MSHFRPLLNRASFFQPAGVLVDGFWWWWGVSEVWWRCVRVCGVCRGGGMLCDRGFEVKLFEILVFDLTGYPLKIGSSLKPNQYKHI